MKKQIIVTPLNHKTSTEPTTIVISGPDTSAEQWNAVVQEALTSVMAQMFTVYEALDLVQTSSATVGDVLISVFGTMDNDGNATELIEIRVV